jgi:hypothetical protein
MVIFDHAAKSNQAKYHWACLPEIVKIEPQWLNSLIHMALGIGTQNIGFRNMKSDVIRIQ